MKFTLKVQFLFCSLASFSQTPAGSITEASYDATYEIVSIRPTRPESNENMYGFVPRGFTGRGVTLKKMIIHAYGVRSFQVMGGPKWLDNNRYDVEAKNSDADRKKASDQINQIKLRRLLAERFGLVVTHQTKPNPVYFLQKQNGKTQMAASTDPRAQGGNFVGQIRNLPGIIDGKGVPMPIFPQVLSQQLERPVIDKTGLTGSYDFRLEFDANNMSADNSSNTENKPSLFQALKEQLGLMLKAGKAPVEMIVVQQAKEPSEN